MGDELLIKNGHVIDPANKINKKCDVLIADEKFVEVGRVKKPVANVIDATGKLVVPGLLHTTAMQAASSGFPGCDAMAQVSCSC